MKRWISVFLAIILLGLNVCTANADFKDDLQSHIDKKTAEEARSSAALLTIDEALANMNEESGRIEVSDDLDEFDPDHFGEIDYGQYRLVILERQVPEKEFTAYDSGYPENYVQDFPDDFTGVDIGYSRSWLRCDLMNRLPEDFRAHSMDEADIVLIAETQYFRSGTISVTDFDRSGGDEIPEFETVEELEEYISTHQPVINKITYYPKFGVYTLIDLYSPVTKDCEVYDYTVENAKRFARNPEAQDIWYDMETLAAAIDGLNSDEMNNDSFSLMLPDLESFVPEEKLEFWSTCIGSEEYSAALSSMSEYYWKMAADLMEADTNEDHRTNYSMVIDAQDQKALTALAEFCNYGGFDTPVELIRTSKEYLAEPDYEWMEEALNEFLALFS